MKIVVTATGEGLDAPTSPVFGRCPFYVFVNTETMAFESVDNPAKSAGGGAGIQAAQFVVEQGAQAVLTGNVGPNAFDVFRAAQVPVHLVSGGTVRQAAEAFKAGRLPLSQTATARAHAGMGRGRGRGRGAPMGSSPVSAAPAAAPSPSPSAAGPAREEEIAALKEMASGLREKLAEIVDRIDQLEKGE